MGEIAEELLEIARYQHDINMEKYRCAEPGNPKYDNHYWKDTTGKIRNIRDMDSMHLCFVIKYLLNVPKPNKFRVIRSNLMKEELKRRNFSQEDYDFNIEGVKSGLYCMYPNEGGNELEKYYSNLVTQYYNDFKSFKF